MAYTAEIQIAVKGARELRSFQAELSKSSDAVDRLNRDIKTLSEGGLPRSFNTLSSLLAVATEKFNEVALETQEAATAARNYVRATDEVNAGLRERAALLKQVADEERKARLGAAGISEATQYAGPIGPGAASPVALSSKLRGRTQQLLDEREGAKELAVALAELEERRRLETNALLDEKAAQVQLNLTRQEEKRKFLAGATQQYQYPIGPSQRSKRFRFEGDVSPERAETALRKKELQAQRKLNQQFFEEEKRQIIELDALRASSFQKQTQRLQALGKTIRGSLSSAAIGGAFPLLFGQSPQAAVGGALGGLLGGQAGGFAGSLIGTALGELVAAKERVSELGAELGFSTAQTNELAKAFDLAGRNSEQLQSAVTNIQGLGLSTKETASAIKISNELAQEYGGKVDKIAQAFANTLESGKVSISTLNSFTAQGIPIQDELARKLNVSRTTLLEMAKDGKVSVQDVINVLVDMGRAAEKTANDSKTGFDEFTLSVKNLATAIADAAGIILKNLVPALNAVLNQLALIIQQATVALSKLGDVQVGQAYAGIFKAAQNRGTLFGATVSKKNIDDITGGLKTLRPATAQSSAEIAKFRQTLEAARIELSKYGGAIGEYATQTAQVEITRLQKEVTAREAALPKEPLGTTPTIQDITAPSQLAPSGGKQKKTGDEAAREAERVAEALRNNQLNTRELQIQLDFSKRIFDAEQAKNTSLAIRLKGEQELAELGIETAQLLEKEKNSAVQLTIAKEQQLKADLIRQRTAQELQKYETSRAEKAAEYLQELEYQLQISSALNKEAETEVRLRQEAAKLRKDGFDEASVARALELKRQLAEPTDLKDFIRSATDDLINLQKTAVTISQGIGNAIANSVSNGIVGLIEGTKTAQQVFEDFLKTMGDILIQEGTRMIAMYIAIGIAKAFAGLGGKGGGAETDTAFMERTANLDLVGDVKLPGFASGGFVTRPTTAMVGEGGEPEYVIPASKMRGAMNRYAAGARGSAVIPSGGGEGEMGGTTVAAPGAIDVRYTVERINSVDYVTADQFRAGMQQAAQQGAQQGEQRTLRRLQMSNSTRKRLGM